MDDKIMTCRDCGNTFTFTAGEQEFYAQKGFGEPSRCPDCRAAKKATRNSGYGDSYGDANSYSYRDGGTVGHTFIDALRGHNFQRELRWSDRTGPACGLGGCFHQRRSQLHTDWHLRAGHRLGHQCYYSGFCSQHRIP